VATAPEEEEFDDGNEPDPGVGIYRWRLASALAGRGRKSNGELLPDRVRYRAPPADADSNASIRSLAFSPDGSVLAAGLWRTQVLRWEFPSGRALPSLAVPPRQVKTRRGYLPFVPPAWRLAFSPDGQTVAAADETVTLYDATTAATRATLPAGPAVRYGLGRPAGTYVHDLAFHPTEQMLATVCGDAVLRWWDGTTAAARESFDCGVGPLTAVAFSPDGCVCAAAGANGQVALVDVDR
jgi:WD40 repeat protein